MFTKTAAFYDAVYSWKDYAADVAAIDALVHARLTVARPRLLDVCCGTGKHLALLRENYEAEGLDLDDELLAIARERLPGMPLHSGSMVDFDLGRQFHVVTCLFSSIGYCQSTADLHAAITCMARHLVPGGVLILEPWLTPAMIRDHQVDAKFVDQPDFKIARISTNRRDSARLFLDFQYLIGTPEGVQHLTETHVTTLFSREEMLAAFGSLDVTFDPKGPMGRGLYVAVKP